VADTFQRLVASLDYTMYLVTAAADGECSGCLIGFSTQCSVKPPRFRACISKKNHTYPVADRAQALVVHVLDRDDRDTAELFGGETTDEIDKFERTAWHPGPFGVPVVEACERWFAGRVVDKVDLGDHQGFVLEPVEAEVEDADDQLTFQQTKDIEPGHEP
jgi:flavin reductase (DIM6/NTAB) family NADH-FMN oxidoreductase RutF